MADLSEMSPFWMVYGIGQREPTFRHPSEDAARREADRLAREHAGKTFVVLEATHAVRRRDLDRFDLRTAPHPAGVSRSRYDVDDDIPF